MTKSLRDSRIDAIKIIYSCEVSKEDIGIVATNILEDEDEVALKWAMNVVKSIDEIDKIIEDCLTNYSIKRLNLVDKAIIELCVSEMLNGTNPKIAINEALEITKLYTDQGDKKAVSFNNKLLDNIRKKLEK